MKQYSSDKIKNVVLLGHGGSGKTTLADALLYNAGIIERIGAVGSTVMDFDVEEKKRSASLGLSMYPIETADVKINLLDAPGQFDFTAGVYEGLSAADNAVIVISGKSGLTVGAKKSYDLAKEMGKGIAFFIGKLNSTHAHYYRVVSALTANYGAAVCPVVAPIVENDAVTAYVNLIDNTAYRADGLSLTQINFTPTDEVTKMRDLLLEAVASTDEALMEKYFEGEVFTEEEVLTALQKGMKSGEICPVFCGVQASGDAVPLFADILYKILPDASQYPLSDENGEEIPMDENAKPKLFVFKTVADPFVGRLSYFKVAQGKATNDLRLNCIRTGKEERLSKIMVAKAAKQEDVAVLMPGDIGCVSKLGDVKTGDTLSAAGGPAVKATVFPAPCISSAVYPKNKGEEEKIAAGMARLCEEDPTISFGFKTDTLESVLSAMGEVHIDVIASRLKAKFGADVVLKTPKVAYRETIKKSAKVQGKYKKQSGGHGQFGDVWIEFSPHDEDDLIFEESVVGGAVPKNFFPAVEKGLRDSVTKGVLAGYPMVGIKANLYDGSYHPVDSSEMSFKTAASLAFKEGIPQCAPVLLEPFGKLTVVLSEDNLGDVIGDINKRRGRIIGMNPLDNKQQEVIGEVPVAEMSDFATAMRSITGGTASFTLEFERYEEVPSHLAQKIIEEANK
ncbi:MAG: elongation factor G [Acutalibacteraceae bacterium]|nr:elongation factor G [Acutalibacteraceae bacterium]